MSAGRRVVSVVMSAGVLAASAAPPAFAHVATPAAAHAPTRIAGTAPEPGRAPRTPSYTGRVVVQLADSTGENVRRTAATAKATVTLARHTATGAAVVDVTGDPVSAARAIAAQPGVEYAVPERRLFPAGDPNDPGYPAQWDLPAIGLPQAWSYSRGTGVTVAVIDTGSLPDPDLAGRWLPGYDFVSDPAYALDGSGRDGDPLDAGDWAPYGVCEDPIVRPSSWHGIHVAGTIAAVVGNATGIAGIAPGSRILPLRALGRCGGTDTDITDAVVWAAGGAVRGVPTNPTPAKIINLSLSGPGECTPVEQRAIDQATALGALVVVAAGNDAADVAGYTPANCRNVLAVGASTPTGEAAPYANNGAAVALSAPGTAISSLGNDGPRTYNPSGWTVRSRSGTSMATPHVSAVAALVWSLAPKLSAGQVRNILLRTATRFPAGTTGYGAGIVNAAAAVDAVRSKDVAAPAIRSVSPNAARFRGGDQVTISGTNLAGAAVLVGGREAAVVSGDATRLVVTVPAGAVGPTQLEVVTTGGTTSVPFRLDERYVVRRSGHRLTPQP